MVPDISFIYIVLNYFFFALQCILKDENQSQIIPLFLLRNLINILNIIAGIMLRLEELGDDSKWHNDIAYLIRYCDQYRYIFQIVSTALHLSFREQYKNVNKFVVYVNYIFFQL